MNQNSLLCCSFDKLAETCFKKIKSHFLKFRKFQDKTCLIAQDKIHNNELPNLKFITFWDFF